MIFSSAYATTLGVLVPLITRETLVVSDALNHNCIINAMKLSRPAGKAIYRHLDLEQLDEILSEAAGTCQRVVVVTDGIFSMRGDHAPLDKVSEIVQGHDASFPQNAILVVDDSHGVGAFGETGRGTEEVTGGHADVLIATLGKALGVNGGYVTGDRVMMDYLREKAPLYIYSNPITPSEAAAALRRPHRYSAHFAHMPPEQQEGAVREVVEVFDKPKGPGTPGSLFEARLQIAAQEENWRLHAEVRSLRDQVRELESELAKEKAQGKFA